MTRHLAAWMNNRLVGTFTENPPYKISFAYDKTWCQNQANGIIPQISISLPVLPPEQSQDATSFVAGLLPDSIRHRNILAAEMNIENDLSDFSFLAKMGRDTAGALTVTSEKETSFHNKSPSIAWLEKNEFAIHLRSLPKRPLLFNQEDGIILSLAGVNDKTAVIFNKGRIGLPRNGFPTTHIVKVDIPGLQDSIRTEQFCLDVARKTGLEVPKSKIMTVDNQTFMIMARYDRVMRNGSLIRIHQENFCQALGIMPAQKYQRHGGPGWPECFELIKKSSSPARDRNSLLQYTVFQYLCGNPDAHAKNYSLIYRDGPGGLRLAPLYDLNNAAAHRHNFKSTRSLMAMSIGNRNNSDEITGIDWHCFARDCKINEDIVIKTLNNIASRILSGLPDPFASQSSCDAVSRAKQDIETRCLQWSPNPVQDIPEP